MNLKYHHLVLGMLAFLIGVLGISISCTLADPPPAPTPVREDHVESITIMHGDPGVTSPYYQFRRFTFDDGTICFTRGQHISCFPSPTDRRTLR